MDPSKINTKILGKAAAAVYGARQKDYGTPQQNHQLTADLLNTYFGTSFTKEDVCIINILQKLSRMKYGEVTEDGCTDIAGYAENLAICAEVKKNSPPEL
jgi:hypothetical protein